MTDPSNGNEEAIQARRRLMTGDDPEKAAAAAFELGVYYMSQLNGAAEAESCFRHAIEQQDPVVATAALTNLAGLLQTVGRIDEAIEIYRRLIDLNESGTQVKATYALGVVLSGRPPHMGEGEALLRHASASDDSEYGPLASYDLGVLLANQPGRLSEGLDALARAAASNHPTYSTRAWFNLGVLWAEHGSRQEAEGAYRRVIASGDPELCSMAAVNLGSLLDDQGTRVADAESAYRVAIESDHPHQKFLAKLNLGNMLARLPERRGDSEAAYRGAMLSPDPHVAASAAYNLGCLLAAIPSRAADAEAAFRAAVAAGDPEHAPIALYNLGRLLGEHADRWDDARGVLEAARNSGDPRVVALADNLLSRLDVSTIPERLVPILDDTWRCARVASQGGFYIEEYLPVSETSGNWTAIVTAVQLAQPDMTPLVYMDALRQDVESTVNDGRLAWQVIERSDAELIYESEISGDVATVDQNELSRIVQHNGRIYTIQHAIRGDLARARKEKARRLATLRNARFVRAPAPSPVASAAIDESLSAAIIDRLATLQTMSIADRIVFCRDGVKQLSKNSHRLHWGLLNFQLALALIQRDAETPANETDLDEIVACLRRALEILRPDTNADLWGRALAMLGRVELARARRHSRHGEPAEQVAVGQSISHAIAAFEKALTSFQPGTYDWCRIMVDLGDARLNVDADAAVSTYTETLSVMENMPPVRSEDYADGLGMALNELNVRAIVGIQDVDRLKNGDPIVSESAIERPKRGSILYLRPLFSAGHFLLPNQCVAGTFDAGYSAEPDNITLEALLYRSLAGELTFFSLGGRPEGYGGTRIIMASGGANWKSTLSTLERTADIVLIVPHLSDGVRWEIDLLSERGSFGKSLFVMPPLATDTDVPKIWADATPMMAERGLEIPRYQPNGCIFRFGSAGKVADKWEFSLLWKNQMRSAIDCFIPASA